jgi:hypothetical protein
MNLSFTKYTQLIFQYPNNFKNLQKKLKTHKGCKNTLYVIFIKEEPQGGFMNKSLKIAKAALKVALSLIATCLIFAINIIVEIALNYDSKEESENNNFYVIDEQGNEIIDDGVTHIFTLDNQRDYKDLV